MNNLSKVLWTSEKLSISGNKYEDFKEAIKKLAEHTHVKCVHMDQTKFVFPIYLGSAEPTANGDIAVQQMNHEDMEAEILCKRPKIKKKNKKQFPADLFDEWYYNQLPIMQPNDEIQTFFLSPVAIPTLCQMAKVSGDDTLNCGNIYRNKHMAYQFTGQKGRDCQIVYRDEMRLNFPTPIRKIISVNSDRYGYVPQTVVCEIIDSIVADGIVGKFDVVGFSIDQEFTKIIITFPEIQEEFDKTYKLPAKLLPGLLIQTSDAAQSSLTVKGIIMTPGGKNYITLQEKPMKHTSHNASGVGKFVKDCEKEIFPDFRKLPEALVQAMSMDIGDPKADLTNSAEADKNMQLMSEIIKDMTDSMIGRNGHKSRVTASLAKDITEAIMAEINPQIHYTRYDVAMIFLGLPDRIAVQSSVKTSLLTECSQIPYRVIAEKKPKEKLVLMP